MFGGPRLVVHLCLLFTAINKLYFARMAARYKKIQYTKYTKSTSYTQMLRHSFVPSSFQFGILLPIPKDKHGDLSNLDMYRGITLAPAISRLFESVLLAKYGNVLHSDCLQYGFKKDISCSRVLFNFTELVRFYNKRRWIYKMVRPHQIPWLLLSL